MAVDAFQAQYRLNCRCTKSYDELLGQAQVIAITTAWPEFRTVRDKTNTPVVDCRFML